MVLTERTGFIYYSDNTVEAPRLTAEVTTASAGERVNRRRIPRLMRKTSMIGYVKKRRVARRSPVRPSRRFSTCSGATTPPPDPSVTISATSPASPSATPAT